MYCTACITPEKLLTHLLTPFFRQYKNLQLIFTRTAIFIKTVNCQRMQTPALLAITQLTYF